MHAWLLRISFNNPSNRDLPKGKNMNNEQCSHYHDFYHDLSCMVFCTAGCCFVIVIAMVMTITDRVSTMTSDKNNYV